MEKVALITDSSCDLSQELIKENNIEVIPLRVIYSSGEYRDGVDITPDEIYRKLGEEIPKTSMPSPGDVINKFEEIKAKGFTHCIVISLSSGLSGTYNMIKLVAEDITNLKIEIIDSKILSMGLGLIVLEAAKHIRNNMPFEEIIERVHVLISKAKGFFVLDTLEYLRKGGRIGRVAAAIGTMLNIKPIISFDEHGKYYSFSKVRGKSQGIDKMVEQLAKQLEHTKLNVAILQGLAQDEANALAKKLQSFKNIGKLYISQISPALGVHTGPGLVGLTFCPEE